LQPKCFPQDDSASHIDHSAFSIRLRYLVILSLLLAKNPYNLQSARTGTTQSQSYLCEPLRLCAFVVGFGFDSSGNGKPETGNIFYKQTPDFSVNLFLPTFQLTGGSVHWA